ncbi:MAG: hypothetical protein QW101_04910 [Ignisphaera sp.]|uniref:VapC9 PIN-like domain-containing protein n=1 Tax=Ignisphaera aggregans TaxID=334771 RepID=A0A7J3MZ75_9CREN
MTKTYSESSCIAILDTSIILLIAQNKIKYDDVIEAINGCTPSLILPVFNELKHIASENTERGRLALWTLNNLVSKLNMVRIEGNEVAKGDEAIFHIINKLKDRTRIVVVTADIELKNKLIKNHINVVWYREAKNGLESITFLI